MQYRKFGKLDWQVSALGFGCMRLPTIGGDMGNIDQEKTTEMIHTAIEAGVNYFDTAYVYHDQKSEAALGKALTGSYRDRVRVATKLPVRMMNSADDFDRMLDEQLQRLHIDAIDFYLLHALDRDLWAKVQRFGLIEKAEAAIADGRIRHLGFSFHDNLDLFKQIIDAYNGWTFCQIQYNYLDVDYQAGTEGLQYAAARGLAVVVMESLRGGKLAVDYPATRPIWNSFTQKRTPADWAFQWLWNLPEVSLALSGMSTLQQVKENIVSASESGVGTLSADDLVRFGQAREAIQSLSPIPCTRCEYCMPCPNGVNIPRNFDVYNQVGMFNDIEHGRFEYRNFVAEDQKAANCIQCEECLAKCPQHIQISTWMPLVEEVLGLGHEYVHSV